MTQKRGWAFEGSWRGGELSRKQRKQCERNRSSGHRWDAGHRGGLSPAESRQGPPRDKGPPVPRWPAPGCAKPEAPPLGSPTCTPGPSWKASDLFPQGTTAVGTALLGVQLPLSLLAACVGWTDRQTDRLFGYWLKATKQVSAFAVIKNINAGMAAQQG